MDNSPAPKPTTGPWKIQPLTETAIGEVFTDGAGFYLYGDSANARDEGGEDQIGYIEGEGDARLIASAPDLLAALKYLLEHTENYYDMCKHHVLPPVALNRAMNEARSAIRAATVVQAGSISEQSEDGGSTPSCRSARKGGQS